MAPHIRALREYYDVTLITNGASVELEELLGAQVSFCPVPIQRKVSLKEDAMALLMLLRLFRVQKFSCVHSITPKAGLLAMVAARLAGVPIRIHTFTGQVWATERGARRWLFKFLDKFLVKFANAILADSNSQREYLIGQGVVTTDEIRVLADGSIAGVDTERFQYSEPSRDAIRRRFGIPSNALVFLYLGRLNRCKGVADLMSAFSTLASTEPALHLVVAGPDEAGISADVAVLATKYPGRVHRIDYVDNPQEYMSAADVFCLPSYREGFGSVLLEAASVGIPVIASRIYGITDAVVDGETGLLHEPGNITEISAAMRRLACNRELRKSMGNRARARAIDRFSENRLTRALTEFYRDRFEAEKQVLK